MTKILLALAGWLLIAFAVVSAGLLARLPVPPPALVALLAALTIAIGFATVRHWLMTVDVRALVAIHLVRFVGIAFLVLVKRGVLSVAFVPIGWGDAIAATGALLILIARPSRGWLVAWNVFGLADMLLLIVTGIRLGMTDPAQFALFRQLPFGLLPTFFVPLIIATHVFMLRRLFTAPGARAGSAAS